MVDKYIPSKGDVIWVNFDPVKGHEQGGKRPALVITSKEYNLKSGLLLACPITSKQKNYPMEVSYKSKSTKGSILVDHIRCIDWRGRRIVFVEKLDTTTLRKVENTIISLVITN